MTGVGTLDDTGAELSLGDSPLDNPLERILAEHDEATSITFDTFRRWEDQIHNDPYALQRLYTAVMSNKALADEDGTPQKATEAGLVGYIKGQILKVIEETEKHNTTDDLTGLSNKRGCLVGIERCLTRANREKYGTDKKVALIYIDVNKFKEEANDQHGHEFGDDILKYVAQALDLYTRPTDLKARVSGDEFVVVLDPFKSENPNEYLKKLAVNVDRYIQRKITSEHPGEPAAVSVSLGMAFYDENSQTGEQLLTNADKAMYHAKKNPITIGIGPAQILAHSHIFDPNRSYVRVGNRTGRG